MEKCSVIFGIILLLALVKSFPTSPFNTYDPPPELRGEYDAWLLELKEAIDSRSLTKIDPKDFIEHDKFNIADLLGADLDAVEFIQDKGDPVRLVEKEMNKKRDEIDKLKKRRSLWKKIIGK